MRWVPKLRLLILVSVLTYPGALAAAVLVLVHGHLSSGAQWQESGVTAALQRSGWRNAGELRYLHGRIMSDRPGLPSGCPCFYTIELADEAPVMVQAQFLAAYLNSIEEVHEGEAILLAGHSAGGVVARAYLVQHPETPVQALVTFFSPHTGTGAAELGVAAGNSPLGLFAPFVGGGTLNRSQSLYRDLAAERPGSFLYWLNRQWHPPITYVSAVRTEEGLLSGDVVVSTYSQDMNNVVALRARAQTIPTSGGHGLQKRDGELLARLLRPWVDRRPPARRWTGPTKR